MIALLFLFLLLLCSPPLLAQDSSPDFERGLGLSDDQRARADQIKRKYMGEMRTLQQEAINRRLQLKELDGTVPENRARMRRLKREIDIIELSKEQTYHQYRSELSRTLNEQQRERYNNYCDSENKRNMRRVKPRGYGP